jgi:hypothetical protein
VRVFVRVFVRVCVSEHRGVVSMGKEESCGIATIKNILFYFNFFTCVRVWWSFALHERTARGAHGCEQIAGLGLTAAGIWVLVDLKKYLALTSTNITVRAWVRLSCRLVPHSPRVQYLGAFLIVFGFILFLLGFFGCAGTLRESETMLSWVASWMRSTTHHAVC